MMQRAFALTCLSVLVCALGPADKIRLTDGKTIDGVQIVSEGMKDVTYKEGKSERSVPSETVLALEYEKRPPQLAEAEQLVGEDDPQGALATLEDFVAGALEKPASVAAFKWAPASAAWRAIEVRQRAGDLEGVVEAAAKFMGSFGESRFVPEVQLAKARAELGLARSAAAQKTLSDLTALIASKSLSKLWSLESRLLATRADERLKPAGRRAEFEKVLGEAGEFPTTRFRAQVLVGESYLAEALANAGGAKDLRAKAIEAFDRVIANEQAPRDAVAGAQAGRGESLFLLGADADDKARLQEAALSCLRVATLYRDQGAYVPKALFYAMRCFDLLPDPKRKADMWRELLGFYPSSAWALEAKKY
jgi:hypothetical protein